MASPIIAEVARAFGAELGESPIWDEMTGTLVFVDILDSSIASWDPVSDVLSVTRLDQRPGAIGLREAGGLIISVESGL